MKKLKTALLLRQQVPPDKERITFNSLSSVDDMWIHLFIKLCEKLDIECGEIWMWGGGPREVRYTDNIVEKWFPTYPTDRQFDFIFARGGFQQYLPVMKSSPLATRVYYGAIYKDRFNPRAMGDNTNYDIVLADSQAQFDQLTKSGYRAFKFLKPACENIFKPIKHGKTFDVLFIGNALQKATKGHEWLLRKLEGSGLNVLQIGRLDRQVLALASRLHLSIEFTGWIPRLFIPLTACRARVGVCCSIGDSCPRIIPEMLAMGIPIVVKKNDKLFIWEDYFTDPCSVLVDENNFIEALKNHVANYDKFDARNFYRNNFTLEASANSLVEKIRRCL
jgi:glycosyltransferase involved in cell wall biosynthesis